MSSRIFAIATAATMTLTGVVVGTIPASATVPAVVTPVAAVAATPVTSDASLSGANLLTALASATLTPAQAVAAAKSEANANGINTYISVTNRSTGAVVAQTSNSGTQVASESVMKLMLASYYLVLAGGYQHQSAAVLSRLSYMIRYSDDATANSLFTSSAVPTIAARYGMHSTINATDRVGHWGAVRITAKDMTTFLYKAAHDPEVGPWLLPVMAQVAPVGSDGFNQAFGMNSLSGTHGSKQGWGDDQFWSAANNVINSVGYTSKYYVAILQNSYSYPDPARATSTFAARTIAASTTAPAPITLKNGDFFRATGVGGTYRLAGGAPIVVSTWAAFPGKHTVKTITKAQWNALKTVPANGTYIRTNTGSNYVIVGGAPIYISHWSSVGGTKATITVDAAAVSHAGKTGVWSHLNLVPSDGSYISNSKKEIYRIVKGVPTRLTSWANFGGVKPTVRVDQAAITHAGKTGVWAHLRAVIPNNTFISDARTGQGYVIAGGAPIPIRDWSLFGGRKATVAVDVVALTHAGGVGTFGFLKGAPTNGTFVRTLGNGAIYVIAGGAPLYVSSLTGLGSHPSWVNIDPAAVTRAGQAGIFAHIRMYPSNGTYLKSVPTGAAYRVTSGHPVRIATNGPGAVLVNQLTITKAGSTVAPYNHLR